MSKNEAILMISAPEMDADLYYACEFLAPDPIVFFKINSKKYLILSDLEIDRAKKQAKVHSIFSLSDYQKKIKDHPLKKKFTLTTLIIDSIFKKRKIKNIIIPENFPSLYYQELSQLGFKLTIKSNPFWESRLIKSIKEKNYIRATVIEVEKALTKAINLLQNSKIRKNRIYYGKEVVTSELLQNLINSELMKNNCIAHSTIVASGVQGSYPHHHGSGPIIPHTPIIFDIFPRNAKTLYWGDMTRTFVKGKPTEMAQKMYQAVLKANQQAAKKLKHGVKGDFVHQTACEVLEKAGFKTGKIDGRMQGFIHSTGHGLGLDIHELPSVSLRKTTLKKGNVVTIEPGLYYEKHGGIRIEDDHFITETGSIKLTKFPYFFEIDH